MSMTLPARRRRPGRYVHCCTLSRFACRFAPGCIGHHDHPRVKLKGGAMWVFVLTPHNTYMISAALRFSRL